MSHAVSKIKTAVPTTLSKCLWVNNLSSLTSRFWHGVYISQCLDSSVSVNGLSPAAISPSTRASRVFTSETEDMQIHYVFVLRYGQYSSQLACRNAWYFVSMVAGGMFLGRPIFVTAPLSFPRFICHGVVIG